MFLSVAFGATFFDTTTAYRTAVSEKSLYINVKKRFETLMPLVNVSEKAFFGSLFFFETMVVYPTQRAASVPLPDDGEECFYLWPFWIAHETRVWLSASSFLVGMSSSWWACVCFNLVVFFVTHTL